MKVKFTAYLELDDSELETFSTEDLNDFRLELEYYLEAYSLVNLAKISEIEIRLEQE